MFINVNIEDYLALWRDIKQWYTARRAHRLIHHMRLLRESGQEVEKITKAPYYLHQQHIDRISILDTWHRKASELVERGIQLRKSPLLSSTDKERLTVANAALFAQTIMCGNLRMYLEQQAELS